MARKVKIATGKAPNHLDGNKSSSVRDDRGRFVKGTPAANPSGRPSLAAELPFIEGIKKSTSADKVAQVMARLFDLSMEGDVKAATLFLAYSVGKPVQPVDVKSDGKELSALTADRLVMLQALAQQQVNAWKEERLGSTSNRASGRVN